MTKTEIVQRLRASYGKDFMSLNDIAKCLGIGKDKARTLFANTDYAEMGNRHGYLIDDVAAAVMNLRRR